MAKYLDNDGLLYFWQRIKATFARLSSPAFTGTPTAPTAASGTSTTQLATTEFVANAVAASASGVTGVKGNSESSYRTGNVNLTAANVGAAPTSHASSATTYGTGTSGNYGHVKLSDATNGTAAAASGGTAATPKAVSDALAAAKTYADACGIPHATCSTAYNVAAKVATLDNSASFTLEDSAVVAVTFAEGNSSATASQPTLNVNNTGAKPIKQMNNSNQSISEYFCEWGGHETLIFTYISATQNWICLGSNSYTNKVYSTALAAAPKASPALTGTPTAPTATAGTNTTQIATTAFVASAIATAQSGAAMFKGTIGSSTSTATYTQTTLESAAYKTGWYLVVNSAGTYVGHVCGVGDVIYCVSDKGSSYSANDFTVVQNEIDSITNAEIDAIVAQ
ncbi:MAG: hypothetical protein K5859_03455 [Atopobiaceae bacterium]|nr:hypothetical protein [Atopobiaceae bacterium]